MTRMLLLPAELDGVVHLTAGEDMQPIFDAVVAASPGQGAVTVRQLEAAAAAMVETIARGATWSDLHNYEKQALIAGLTAALSALGLTVQP